MQLTSYTRWTRRTNSQKEWWLEPDILGFDDEFSVDPGTGKIRFGMVEKTMHPDEARMIGVRLIEAAALADGSRAIRYTES